MQTMIKTALTVLAILLPALVSAHDFEVNGIYYNINGNEATVTYQGSYASQYNEYSGAIVIPETVTNDGITYAVTSIGEHAFENCSGMTSIEIPNSVAAIGSWAFYGCIGLKSIEIPNSVTTINDYTFCRCSGLTNMVIPNSIKTIGMSAFHSCSGLTNLSIGNGVTSIDRYAFNGCTSLFMTVLSAILRNGT